VHGRREGRAAARQKATVVHYSIIYYCYFYRSLSPSICTFHPFPGFLLMLHIRSSQPKSLAQSRHPYSAPCPPAAKTERREIEFVPLFPSSLRISFIIHLEMIERSVSNGLSSAAIKAHFLFPKTLHQFPSRRQGHIFSRGVHLAECKLPVWCFIASPITLRYLQPAGDTSECTSVLSFRAHPQVAPPGKCLGILGRVTRYRSHRAVNAPFFFPCYCGQRTMMYSTLPVLSSIGVAMFFL